MSRSIAIPPYRYPLLGSYNGFTGLERARSAQLTRWAMIAGVLPRQTRCSICGAESRSIQFHSENYYDPLALFAVCQSCHRLLHRRFRAPEAWTELVARHAGDGAWFSDLRLAPIDLAADLRREHGESITRILVTVVRQLPPQSAVPRGRLVTMTDFMGCDG
jgi:hypothetical protein